MEPTADSDPRIERTRAVVLASAVEVIAERGFAASSIEAISQQSGVARSTIYRHWSNRSDLLLDAIRTLLRPPERLTPSDLRSDLLSIATFLSESITAEPKGTVIASLIVEARRDEEIAHLHERFVEQRLAAVTGVIKSAVERSELPTSTDPTSVATDLAAPIFFKTLVLRETPDAAWIETLIDQWIAARYRSGAAEALG